MLSLLRAAFVVVVVASVVPYGSNDSPTYHLEAGLNALVLAATLRVPLRSRARRVLFATVTATLALALLYGVLQAWRFEGNPLAAPVWRTVRDVLGDGAGAVSVDPGRTLDALPGLATPFMVFLSAFVLHQDDAAALALWRRLALLGLGIAAYGLVQVTLFPTTLLLESKTTYLDSLTGVFRNRNSVATLFGVTLVLAMGLAFRAWSGLDPREAGRRLLVARVISRDRYGAFFGWVAAFCTVALALFLTRSRAGTGASFVGVLLVAVWCGQTVATRRNPSVGRLATAAGLALAVLVFFAVFASRAIFRMEVHGLQDLRWCTFSSVGAAIRDHWTVGTGLGTFRDVYPAYKTSGCGLYYVLGHADSVYLEGMLALGLPFLVLLALGVATMLGVVAVGFRERQRLRIVAVVTGAALLIMLLHSSLDYSVQVPGIAVFVAAVLGSGSSVCLARRDQTRRAGRKRRRHEGAVPLPEQRHPGRPLPEPAPARQAQAGRELPDGVGS